MKGLVNTTGAWRSIATIRKRGCERLRSSPKLLAGYAAVACPINSVCRELDASEAQKTDCLRNHLILYPMCRPNA